MDMDNRAEYKELFNIDTHMCFGCSPINPSGLQMKFFSKGESVVSWVTVPDHLCGWNNLVHGGVISTMLDEIMGRSSLYLLKRMVLTKSINVDFLKPVIIGKELKVEGKVGEVKSEREADIKGFIYNEEGELCARSTGTFALFTPESIQKMGVMDEALLNTMKKFMK